MKIWKTLLLALVVAAFGAYLWLVEKPAADKADEKKKVLEIDRDRVTQIELQYPDSRIKLARTDGRWRLVEPLATEADEQAVKTLLGAVADAELKKTIDDKAADLAPYGLDKPQAVVRLELEGGQKAAVSVGKAAPVGSSAYARRGDEPGVLLTTTALQSATKKEVKDLRDKTILEVQDDDVREIVVRGSKGPAIVLRREAEAASSPAASPGSAPSPSPAATGWVLVEPRAGRADVATVRGLLSSIRSLRAQDFVDDPAAAASPTYGLNPPSLEIDLLVGADRAKKTLVVGGPAAEASKKQMYVKRGERDTIFVVGDFARAGLEKSANDFRDKTVLAFDKNAATKIRVDRTDGQGFTIEKGQDGGWTLVDPGSRQVKASAVSRFVDDLHDLKGADIVTESGDAARFGLDHPTLHVDLLGADGASIGKVELTRKDDAAAKKMYAAASGSPVVYEMRDYVFERVDKRKDDLLEAPAPSPGAATPAPAAGAGGGDEPQDELDEDEGA